MGTNFIIEEIIIEGIIISIISRIENRKGAKERIEKNMKKEGREVKGVH